MLGWSGRMIYPNKIMAQPTTVFNANIFNSKTKKIWYGDIEIERDKEVLSKLTMRLGTIYILGEHDGRFLKKIP